MSTFQYTCLVQEVFKMKVENIQTKGKESLPITRMSVVNLQWKDKNAMNYQTKRRLPAFYVTSFPKRLAASEFQ